MELHPDDPAIPADVPVLAIARCEPGWEGNTVVWLVNGRMFLDARRIDVFEKAWKHALGQLELWRPA